MLYILIHTSVYRWGSWGTGKWNNLLKVTWQPAELELAYRSWGARHAPKLLAGASSYHCCSAVAPLPCTGPVIISSPYTGFNVNVLISICRWGSCNSESWKTSVDKACWLSVTLSPHIKALRGLWGYQLEGQENRHLCWKNKLFRRLFDN